MLPPHTQGRRVGYPNANVKPEPLVAAAGGGVGGVAGIGVEEADVGEGAGNVGFAEDVGLAAAILGDGYVIDFERAAEGLIVIDERFLEVGASAEFVALRGSEVARTENDVVRGGGAEGVFLLFGDEGLTSKLGGLDGGVDLGAVLLQGDLGVADADGDVIYFLLILDRILRLIDLGASVIGLSGTITNGQA